MNKPEMKRILKGPFSEILKAIKDKDVDKELKSLDDLQSICEDLKCLVEGRSKLLKDSRVKCSCGHYFKSNPKKHYVINRTVCKPTFWDSGYGDDDRYADFKVTDLYENCPKCQKPVAVKLAFFEDQIPGTERDRWGKIYS